ncbi:MAG TPA: GNAT family N-acetyltransferase [Orrella sp.]
MKPLNESVLRSLNNDAFATLLSQAASYEMLARPGLQLTLSNEPVADLNMLVVGAGAEHQHFRYMVNLCLERGLPFLVMIYPEAGAAFDQLASGMGLVFATEFPIMVRDDLHLEPSGNHEVQVVRAVGDEDARANAEVSFSAFHIPVDSVLRSVPASFFDTTGADVYVARLNGDAVGSVALTYHGDTCGVWAMGTDATRQRGGIGRRLLSTAMAQARDTVGIRRFFLGATQAGFRLYESLGFKTVCAARVWVSGTTNQA